MGFKMQRVVVLAGSSEFPEGDTDVLRLSRSQTLLTKCAQALLDCNVGWQLDTSKSATTTSYTDIPDKSGTKNYPGLFFVNTNSGCKLFMAYFGDNVYSYGIKDFSGADVIPIKNKKNHGGLCMSMIPGESSQIFGDPTTSTFIPSDATRIFGTYNRSTSSSPSGLTEYYSAAYNPTSGIYYAYTIMATDSAVMVYVFHDSSSGVVQYVHCPIYVTGKIFGVISHEETMPNAKYGVISFRLDSYGYESWATIQHATITNPYGSGTMNIPVSDTTTSGYTGGSFARADGTWVNGSETVSSNWCNASFYTSDTILCDSSNRTFYLSNSYRWTQIGMIVNASSNSIGTLGVTSGNGFKGYLDTSLFRATNDTLPRKLLDNGRFLCPEATDCGWILGWDPSNPSIDGSES